MKRMFLVCGLAFLLCASVRAAEEAGLADLKIGDPAPGFDLPGIDDRRHTLQDYDGAEVLLVAFLSNHCPDSQGAESRIKQLAADFKGPRFALVAINPNDPQALRPDELGYSVHGDTFPEMKLHAKERGFSFPYLYDGETQSVAKAYGCLATPHIFIFDKDRKLRYKGYFDDSRFGDPATVKDQAARTAVQALLSGKPVVNAVTKPHGCSTKWASKRSLVAVDDEKWETAEVELSPIDASGIAVLRKNNTGKVRIFNVWATWCAPCVAEFPVLVATQRKFGLRPVELITISMDQPSDLAKAKAFLEKQNAAIPEKLKPSLKAEGRTTNAYLYTGGSVDPLIEALDTEWPGPIPHTLVVAPGGEVIYRHNGKLEPGVLVDKILGHLGRFYVPEAKP